MSSEPFSREVVPADSLHVRLQQLLSSGLTLHSTPNHDGFVNLELFYRGNRLTSINYNGVISTYSGDAGKEKLIRINFEDGSKKCYNGSRGEERLYEWVIGLRKRYYKGAKGEEYHYKEDFGDIGNVIYYTTYYEGGHGDERMVKRVFPFPPASHQSQRVQQQTEHVVYFRGPAGEEVLDYTDTGGVLVYYDDNQRKRLVRYKNGVEIPYEFRDDISQPTGGRDGFLAAVEKRGRLLIEENTIVELYGYRHDPEIVEAAIRQDGSILSELSDYKNIWVYQVLAANTCQKYAVSVLSKMKDYLETHPATNMDAVLKALEVKGAAAFEVPEESTVKEDEYLYEKYSNDAGEISKHWNITEEKRVGITQAELDLHKKITDLAEHVVQLAENPFGPCELKRKRELGGDLEQSIPEYRRRPGPSRKRRVAAQPAA